jgi:glutamate synthase domain-containing protein 2
MALGADITSLGTATLMALGCLMVHKCHIGYCPAVLTNKIAPNQARSLSLQQSIKWLVNLINGWTEEMQVLMERIGHLGHL